jgi:hypothetical protein
MSYLPDYFNASSLVSGSVEAVTGSMVTILPVNVNRKSFYIFNDSPAVLYIKFGSVSGSVTDYAFQVPSLSLYESHTPCPRVEVRGVWTAVTGTAYFTEIT